MHYYMILIAQKGIYLPLPDLQSRTGCDTRSVSNWSKAGLNSEFSFLTGCLIKTKEPV